MGREITLAGLRLTADEWESFDDGLQLELLRALTVAPAARGRDDDAYEAYELSFDGGSAAPERELDVGADFTVDRNPGPLPGRHLARGTGAHVAVGLDLVLEIDLGVELALALGRRDALSASPVS
jgi:hypothetical protein